ncbi:Rv3654c family TadE-like protein [Herbiconiux sp. KACC 21604]|uniref:Rv3654c family TadE-like protein n=1 Tax=unclassified Herbiconiux TaxID=2618217 RepID=UPI0014929FFD|nr:Rv3654c family TadE-like protein [Herbiconiux sp. SALV-R1]QJU54520.1 hypothetical protein HL652_13385 [Herbiconiux sp. SALV-R1]WPO85603.1 Rv3654c family TadE-like protein [Herbiconiux sp. KACC 21604]
MTAITHRGLTRAGPDHVHAEAGTPRRSEEGSGSVLGLALITAFALAAALFVPMGGALAAGQQLRGAADAAALAAADTASGRVAGEPCAFAAEAAGATGAALTACTVDASGTASVTVATTIVGIAVTVRARAGPPQETIAST